jgi:hypothetical protein
VSVLGAIFDQDAFRWVTTERGLTVMKLFPDLHVAQARFISSDPHLYFSGRLRRPGDIAISFLRNQYPVVHNRRRGPWRNVESVKFTTRKWVGWCGIRRLFERVRRRPVDLHVRLVTSNFDPVFDL